MARSCEFEPKTRSTRVPVHCQLAGLAVAALEDVLAASDVAVHSVPMSSRFTKKSLVSVPGRSVKTPRSDCP